jgi:hypothetical protein
MNSPRIREKKEHPTTIQPWIFSQLRFIGRARAGREVTNVANTKIALTTPARIIMSV